MLQTSLNPGRLASVALAAAFLLCLVLLSGRNYSPPVPVSPRAGRGSEAAADSRRQAPRPAAAAHCC